MLNNTSPAGPLRERRRTLQRTIIASSQVCSSWRQVALEDNRLWQRLFDLKAYSLSRNYQIICLSSPLLIDIGHKSAPLELPGRPGLLRLLLQFKDRIREWNVNFNGTEVNDRWWKIFDTTTLSLEAFKWTGVVASSAEASVINRPSRSPCPSLRRLSLTTSNLPFHRLLLPNLTELYVANVAQGHHPLSVHQWLDVLRTTPCLEYLHIHRAVQSSGLESNTLSLTPVDLPSLRLITIGEEKSGRGEAFSLLDVITASSTCGLTCILPQTIDQPYLSSLKAAILRTHKDVKEGLYHFPFNLYVDRNSKITMSNVRNAKTRLDWNGLQGSNDVSNFLESLGYNGLSICVPAPMSRSFWDVQKILGEIVYPHVTSMHFTIHQQARKIPMIKSLKDVTPVLPLLLQNLAKVHTSTFDGDCSFLPVCASLKQWDGDSCAMGPVMPLLKSLRIRGLGEVHWPNIGSYLTWREEAGFPVDGLEFVEGD